MKNLVLLFVLMVSAFCVRAQRPDTFQVYFPLNVATLAQQQRDAMDQLIFKDYLIHGQKLIILGFTDYVGTDAYNDSLSAKRARVVKEYLVASGFGDEDIKLCIGKGKIGKTPVNGNEGTQEDRKVQIIIDKAADMANGAVAKQKADSLQQNAAEALASAGVNTTVALSDILFEPGIDVLLPQSLPQLDVLYNFLIGNKHVKIQIEGHVCCISPTDSDTPFGNSTLSAYRALAVYTYLLKKGIDRSRMTYKGLGASAPLISPEVTDEDRQKNRRVEVRITGR